MSGRWDPTARMLQRTISVTGKVCAVCCARTFRPKMKLGNLKKSRAFTLAEIILAIAMIAAVSAITAALWLPDVAAVEDRSPSSVIKNAIVRARAESAKSGEQVAMCFDRRGFFVISYFKTRREIVRIYLLKATERLMKSDESAAFENFRSPTQIAFFAQDPEIIEKSTLEFPDEQLKEIRFAPDGSMTPCYAVITIADSARIIYFDPFTGDEDETITEGQK